MSVVDTTEAILRVMENKNVASIWFHREVGTMHNGSANVQCTNPIVYRSFVNKKFIIEERIFNDAKHDELQAKIDAVHMNIMKAIQGLGDIKSSTSRPAIEYSKNVDWKKTKE